MQSIEEIGKTVRSMLRPNVVLDLLANFTSYAAHKGKQRINGRYQQLMQARIKVVERVVMGILRKA